MKHRYAIIVKKSLIDTNLKRLFENLKIQNLKIYILSAQNVKDIEKIYTNFKFKRLKLNVEFLLRFEYGLK